LTVLKKRRRNTIFEIEAGGISGSAFFRVTAIRNPTMLRNHLIAAAICLNTVLLVSLAGCATPKPGATGLCRNTAIYCAQFLDEFTQFEVVCGITVDNINHCQARCVIGGQVKWISWQNGHCTAGKEEHRFVANLYRVMSVAEAVEYISGYFPSINRNINEVALSYPDAP